MSGDKAIDIGSLSVEWFTLIACFVAFSTGLVEGWNVM